jgi:hypothetical protein
MTILIAADPGVTGALCLYDTKLGMLSVFPMPTYEKATGKKTLATATKPARPIVRNHLDEDEVIDRIAMFKDMGATHFVVEKVGGLPGQSAPNAFTFGFGYGILVGAAKAAGLIIEKIEPAKWKADLRVPADKKAARARASELLPTHKHLWPKAGDDGKAEAALLALWLQKRLEGWPKR